MQDKSILRMVHLALLGALVFVATYLIKITMPIGYIHVGDGMIMAGAVLLGPLAWIPAALGSALADLMLGYSAYILPTFLIKGLMGFTAGSLVARVKKPGQAALVFLLAEVLMVLGYYVAEAFMYGPAGALAGILPNTIQGISGVVIGLVLYPVMVNLKRRFAYM